jgi:predicted PurR-regulated permease PerM
MASFIPFLVYFMLSWRNHIHRSLLAIYGSGNPTLAGRSLRTIANMARAYVVGNVILGLIISFVSCIIFWTWHLPYWVLIGFISGFLSLIPYVGLPLALIPAIGAALMTYTAITPYLIISIEVAALHLVALNFLYPAVVGARVHLNPLAVTVALMFWGTLWGGIGLILAIPITAALKAVLDNNEEMQAYGRLLGD